MNSPISIQNQLSNWPLQVLPAFIHSHISFNILSKISAFAFGHTGSINFTGSIGALSNWKEKDNKNVLEFPNGFRCQFKCTVMKKNGHNSRHGWIGGLMATHWSRIFYVFIRTIGRLNIWAIHIIWSLVLCSGKIEMLEWRITLKAKMNLFHKLEFIAKFLLNELLTNWLYSLI